MADNKPPAFQFYAKAWMSSTAHMSLEAQGAYARLMAWSWDNGPLPTAEAGRARLVGLTPGRFRKVWAEFSAKWLHTDKGMVNLRLEQQRADLEAFRVEQAEKGKRGASKRWGKDGRGHSSGHAPATSRPMAQAIPDDGSSVSDLHSSTPEIKSTETRPRETALTPVWTNRPPARIGLVGDHRRCEPELAVACARGVCVSSYLLQQWRQQVNPEDRSAADAYIRAFVESVMASVSSGPLGDALPFWGKQWQNRHAQDTPRRPRTRNEESIAAASRVLERVERRRPS